MKNKSIFLIAQHRYDLIFYSRIINFYKKKNYSFKLIITQNLYEENSIQKYLKDNDFTYIIIPKIRRKHFNILKLLQDIFKFRLWISKIPKNNLIIILDKSDIISKVFLKKFNNLILIQQIEKLDQNYYFNLRLTCLKAIQSILFGGRILQNYTNRISAKHMSNQMFFKFNTPENILIHANNKNLNNSFFLPHLNLKLKKNKIVIFGSRFNDWRFISGNYKKDFYYKIDSIYNEMAAKFSNDFRIDYIPHPRESGTEFKMINKIFDFKINNLKSEYFSSEHYLLNNMDTFMTYSLASTSSMSSYNMGFQSKVFYKMLGLADGLTKVFDNIFFGAQEDFFSKNLNDLFKNYEPTNYGNMRRINDLIDTTF